MPRTDGAEFTIDASDILAEVAEAFAKKRANYLASLSPEQRAAAEAAFAKDEAAALRKCEEDERAYEGELEAVKKATDAYHRQIQADRKAGAIGTLAEVGRPFGLSAVAVGRILDEHGLRERWNVDVEGTPPGMRTPVSAPLFGTRYVRADGGPLHIVRGVVEGVAVFDPFDAREYWIVAKVQPLLAPHAKPRKK